MFSMIITIVVGILVLFWFRLKDQKYLKKKTKDVLSKSVLNEIEKEKEEYLSRKERFQKLLQLKKNG